MVQKVLHEENSRAKLFTGGNSPGTTKTFTQYVAAIVATFSAFAMGQCLSWTSAAIPMLQEPNSVPFITDEEGSWIGSLIAVGAFAGAIPAGTVATKLGPKRTLQILALPLFTSWLLIAYSGCVWGLYAARILAGLAAGAVCVAAPMYVAQLAEPKIRGTLGTFFQLQITAGILFGYILGGSVADFRVLALISSVVPVVFLATFSFLPESPVFLSSKGNVKQARINLQWFRGENYDVEEELTRIEDNIREANLNKAKITDLANCKATSRALVVSLGLMVFQQLSGINAVLFYTGKIFEESGSSFLPSTSAILVGAVQVAATYLSTILIDRAGRRILLIISSSVMSLCLGCLGLYFYLRSIQDMSDFSLIPLVSLATYVIVFSIGFGPIPWIMMGELFLPKMVGMASSISAAMNWLLAFTVTKLFQKMLDALGSSNTFNTFGVICALACAFVILKVPETKGKSIHEIRKYFTVNNDEDEGVKDEDVVTITVKS